MGGPAGILASNLLHLLPYLCICINIFICICREVHCIDLYQYLYLYLFAFLCPFHNGGFVRVSSWVVHNTIEYNSLIDLLHIAQHPVQFNLFCAVRNANPCFTEHTVWVLPPVVCHIAVLCCGERVANVGGSEQQCWRHTAGAQWRKVTVLGGRGDKGRVMGVQSQAGQDTPILP